MTKFSKEEVRIPQGRINASIRAYLRQQNRDPALIDRFKSGHCAGLAILAAYGSFLEDQHLLELKLNPPPCDDYDWFEATAQLLCNWDRKLESLSSEDIIEIERFIGLVASLHQTSGAPFNTKQHQIETTLLDTKGRKPTMEYRMGGLFSPEDLSREFKLDKSPHTSILNTLCSNRGRIVLFNSMRHMTSMYVAEATDHVFLYNANNPYGRRCIKITDTNKIARAILNGFGGRNNKPAPISIRVYTMDGQKAIYPEPYILLSKAQAGSNVEKFKSHNPHNVGLLMAVRTKCISSTQYFLEQGADPHTATLKRKNKSALTPYEVSKRRNLFPAIKAHAIKHADFYRFFPPESEEDHGYDMLPPPKIANTLFKPDLPDESTKRELHFLNAYSIYTPAFFEPAKEPAAESKGQKQHKSRRRHLQR